MRLISVCYKPVCKIPPSCEQRSRFSAQVYDTQPHKFLDNYFDRRNMMTHHKNKTHAMFLASAFGGLGAHRFYLHGRKDLWAWAHLLSLPASILISLIAYKQQLFFTIAPLIISILVSIIEALVIGVTPDEKWDAKFNVNSGKNNFSDWPLAGLLVLMVGLGATALIAVLARTSDLLFTGGSYG